MQTRSRAKQSTSSERISFPALRERKLIPPSLREPQTPRKRRRTSSHSACTARTCAVMRLPPIASTQTAADEGLRDRAMALLRADGRFDAVIAAHGPAGPFERGDVFDSCVRAVVFQQLHGKAAGTIFSRLRALLGVSEGRAVRPCDIVGRPEEELRGAGLSRTKAAWIKECAVRWHEGEFSQDVLEGMGDEEVQEKLMSLKGFGEWSAQMVMIGSLQRKDVLPLGDMSMVKGAGMLFGKTRMSKLQVEEAFESLRPFRSYACWYTWKLVDT